MSASLEDVAVKADKARESVGTAATALREIEQLAPQAATQLDDLSEHIDRFAEYGNTWAQELQLQLEAVKIGAVDLEDFINKFGSVVVQTEEGAKTIRESLEGMDLREYEERIADFIKGLQKGSVDLGEVMEYLTENA
ncbi:MAG: hypothetical protein KJ058_12590, partial [Thermoanaerobaculia bacterium]|nr:hypothetical protein [Thermoanaerobaculia bacterium]